MDMISDATQVLQHETRRAAAVHPGHRDREARAGAEASHGEYLSFKLGDEHYGIDILRVQEIRSYENPTRIANAPAFVKGVVNLRGVIVPIIDLRLKLGCVSADYNGFTVVIVLNLRDRVVGAVVDSVSDVLALAGDSIRPAPQLSDNADTRFITGMASVGDKLLTLLDIEALLHGSELNLIDRLRQPVAAAPG